MQQPKKTTQKQINIKQKESMIWSYNLREKSRSDFFFSHFDSHSSWDWVCENCKYREIVRFIFERKLFPFHMTTGNRYGNARKENPNSHKLIDIFLISISLPFQFSRVPFSSLRFCGKRTFSFALICGFVFACTFVGSCAYIHTYDFHPLFLGKSTTQNIT